MPACVLLHETVLEGPSESYSPIAAEIEPLREPNSLLPQLNMHCDVLQLS